MQTQPDPAPATGTWTTRLRGRADPRVCAGAAPVAVALVRDVLSELQLVLGVLRGETAQTDPDGELHLRHELVLADLRRVHDLASSSREGALDVESSGGESFRRARGLLPRGALPVLQEALTNARPYGEGRASLRVERGADGVVTVTVRNCVNVSERRVSCGSGHGLAGMEERVAALGNALHAGREGHDFVVLARVPVVTATAAHGLREAARV